MEPNMELGDGVALARATTPTDAADGAQQPQTTPEQLQEPQEPRVPLLRPPIVRHVDSPLASPPSAPIRALLLVKTQNEATPSVQSERSRHLHARKVTRDIAALDFLQNIPMRSERAAVEGAEAARAAQANDYASTERRHRRHRRRGSNGDLLARSDSSSLSSSSSSSSSAHMDGANDRKRSVQSAASSSGNEGLAGRRLPGMDATIVRVPALFRYRFTTKFPAASAVVRRWEGVTAQQGLPDARLFFSSACGYPIATSTILHYNGNATTASAAATTASTAMRRRFASVGNLETPQSYYDWRGKSYYRLLHATWCPCSRERDSEDAHPEPPPPYVANYLDDPEFRQGRHRHVVRGDKNIGPVVSSILLFVKPHELKEELNKKFQEKHPWLADTGLSLSKIRNLKREALASCQRADLEVATGGLACLLFEKLVLSRYVTKANRKLYMAVCLLLAAKFNEPKGAVAMKTVIRKVLADIDQVHSIPAREVLQAEFMVYAQLSFNLHVPINEVQPHFTRLLKLIESNPRKYLDDDAFTAYSTLLMIEEQQMAQKARDEREEEEEEEEEGTDVDGLLSEEDEEEPHLVRQRSVEGDDDLSMFSWNRVSFAQWWSGRGALAMRPKERREQVQDDRAVKQVDGKTNDVSDESKDSAEATAL